ncbi:MAG TPA: DUF6183 family protein [Actinomycetota bacterium]|nr:DUF6183 family protein [Actinomycetota bacterium]
MSGLEDLVEAAEPNPLLRRVDALCASRSWDELVELARRCVEAGERGKQLWPIAQHIEYRLALEAPGEYAATVLKPGAGKFALGPLTEVAASTHTFDEVAPFITVPPAGAFFAAERVIRGEDLSHVDSPFIPLMELPASLEDWEPAYALAVYKSNEAEFGDPPLPETPFKEVEATPVATIDDPDLETALTDLVSAWVSESNAVATCAVVEGSYTEAIAATGALRFQVRELPAVNALGLMAWAAASGGAHGRRRGAARGRFGAWYAAAEVADLAWPPAPDQLHSEITGIQWFQFKPEGAGTGWNLHIAVTSEAEGWSAAISAIDRTD